MSIYSNYIKLIWYVHVCTQESAEGGDVGCAYDVIRQPYPTSVTSVTWAPLAFMGLIGDQALPLRSLYS